MNLLTLEKIYMAHRTDPVRPHTERKGFTICICSRCEGYRNELVVTEIEGAP